VRRRAWTGLLVLASLLSLCAHAADTPLRGGPKKTIAVGGFEAAAGSPESGDGLSAMLTTALLKDPHFIVVERQAMDQIHWEQQASGAPPGQVIGAGVLIRGTVTKFDPHSGGASMALGGLLGSREAGSLGIGSSTAVVEITLRLIDTANGRIIASSSARGEASASNFDASLYQRRGLSIGVGGFSETPMGQACEKAIDKAVGVIDAAMEQVPWSSTIVDNDGDQIFVSGGADAGLQPGTTLHVYRKVKDLTDPATGAVLETITSAVGTIQVRDVHDKVSIAAFVAGAPPMRGDIVRLD